MINACKNCIHFKPYDDYQKEHPEDFRNDGICSTERCTFTTREEWTCDSFEERTEK